MTIGVILSHNDAQYEVGTKIAGSEDPDVSMYRLYLCREHSTGRECLLQIAADVPHNGPLTRAAIMLQELRRTSDLCEAEYARRNPGSKLLSYAQLFPELLASFAPAEQGGRLINILAFPGVTAVPKMAPLSSIEQGGRLDLKTSAWIMGRLLKLLAFIHELGIAVRLVAGNNILISPDDHVALVLDWSAASRQPDLPLADRRDDIAQAAQAVFAALGGDPETGAYSYDIDEQVRPYIEYVWHLASGRMSDATEAHTRFYELVHSLFGYAFHPFTTLPR